MDTVRNAIKNYFHAISRLDADGFVNSFAADGVDHEPGNPPLEGHEAIRAFFNGVSAGFESIEMTPDEIYIVGHEAAVKWSARGTGKNGAAVSFEGIDTFVIDEGGKIRELHGYWDPAGMMAQLTAG